VDSVELEEEPFIPNPVEVKHEEVKLEIKRHKASDVDEGGQGSLF
jgi:hypothetical protein